MFYNNTADVGGALSLRHVQFAELINNTFTSNTAKIKGGAINCALSGHIFYTVRLYNFLNN